jgi:aryl-alcohol dehydrogenase-like predicted oxidoreductase
MGEDPGSRSGEIAALRRGLELGLSLIDTAEMYAEGGAEKVIAEVISGRRDEVFLVSKVYPHNAWAQGGRSRPASAASGGWAPITSISICCTDAAPIPWPRP